MPNQREECPLSRLLKLEGKWEEEGSNFKSVRERRNILWQPLYLKSKKKWYKWTYLQNRNRLTDFKKAISSYQGEGREEGRVRQFGMEMYTLLYLKWIPNRDLLSSTGNSAQCHVAAWMGGEFGEMDSHGCTAESFQWSPETVTALSVYQLHPNTKKTNRNPKQNRALLSSL